MHEAQVLVKRSCTGYFRIKTDTLDIPFLRDLDSTDIGDCRENISKVCKPVTCLSTDLIAPGYDERHVRSSVVWSTLSSSYPAAVLLFGNNSGRSSVVGRENEYGIIPYTLFLEVRHHVSHLFVKIFHHIPEVASVLARSETAFIVPIPII